MSRIRDMSIEELGFVSRMPEFIRKEIEAQVEKGCFLEIEEDAPYDSSSGRRNILLDGVPVFEAPVCEDTS